ELRRALVEALQEFLGGPIAVSSGTGPLARARAILEGVHLLHWLGTLAVFVVTSAASYMQGVPIVISLLAGIGATAIAMIILVGVYWLVHSFPRLFGLQIALSKAVSEMYARLETSRYPAMMPAKKPDEQLEWMCNSLLANRNDAWRVQFY